MRTAPKVRKTEAGGVALPALGVVLAFTAEELLGYQAFSFAGGWTVSSYALLCAVETLIAAVLLVWGPQFATYVAHPATWIWCGAAAVAGYACLAMAGEFGVAVLATAGFTGLCTGSFALKVACLAMLAQLPPRQSGRVVFAGVVIQAFAAPLFTVAGTALWTLALACIALGLVVVRHTCMRTASATGTSDGSSAGFRKRFTASAPVLVGFAVLCASIAYLNPMLLYPGLSPEGFVALGFGTHFAAALAFGACAFAARDPSYAVAFKSMNSLVLVAFILLALLGSQAALPRALCTATLSLVEFVTFLTVADIASFTSTDRLRVFGGYYLLMRSCSLCGLGLQALDGALFAAQTPFAACGVALAVLMVVASIWLVNETNLNRFLWGTTLLALAGDNAGDSVGQSARDDNVPGARAKRPPRQASTTCAI